MACEPLIPSPCGGTKAPYLVGCGITESMMPSFACGEDALTTTVRLCLYFNGLTKITIEQGESLDLYTGVTVTDKDGNEYEFTITPDPDSFSTDTPGTYWFTYEAEGQTANREVEITALKKTVLYTDKTLIINELSTDRQANIALHGSVKKEYYPLDSTHPYIYGVGYGVPWSSQYSNIYYVEIGSPISPTDTHSWFANAYLRSCDFTGIDTSQVTDMSQMFYTSPSNSAMTSLDLRMFDTSNVTNMSQMFYGRSGLEDIDLSRFDTSNVTTMLQMFEGCSALETLDLAHFDTSSVTDFRRMFHTCTNLHALYEDFDTSAAVAFDGMFAYCSALTSLDLSNWNTSNVLTLDEMFYGCSALVTLNLCEWDSTKFRSSRYMFFGCGALTTIYSSSWYGNSALPTFQTAMWSGCSSLVGGSGTTLDTEHLDETAYAKVDGGSSDMGYFTSCTPNISPPQPPK